MVTHREFVEYAVALGVLAALAVGMLAGEQLVSLFEGEPGLDLTVETLRGPLFVLVVGLLGVAVWAAAMWVLAKLCYRVWRRFGDRVTWLVGRLIPQSPIYRFATGLMILLLVLLLILAVLPSLLTT